MLGRLALRAVAKIIKVSKNVQGKAYLLKNAENQVPMETVDIVEPGNNQTWRLKGKNLDS